MRIILILSTLLLLVTAGVMTAAPEPIFKRPLVGGWQLDLGGGLFLPGEKLYDDEFEHGFNGRVTLTYRHRAGILLGLHYRVSSRPAREKSDLDLATHFVGLRLGRDFLTVAEDELSIGFTLYAAYAHFSNPFFSCHSGRPCFYVDASSGETGIGMGISLVYAHQFGRRFGIGFDLEYNSTWLDDLGDGQFGNVGGLWVGPFLRVLF